MSHRPTLYGSRHAVSAGHYLATAAGFSILEAGGMTVTRLDRYYAKGSPKVFGALYEGAAVAS